MISENSMRYRAADNDMTRYNAHGISLLHGFARIFTLFYQRKGLTCVSIKLTSISEVSNEELVDILCQGEAKISPLIEISP